MNFKLRDDLLFLRTPVSHCIGEGKTRSARPTWIADLAGHPDLSSLAFADLDESGGNSRILAMIDGTKACITRLETGFSREIPLSLLKAVQIVRRRKSDRPGSENIFTRQLDCSEPLDLPAFRF